jgi:hypothetical protein
MKYKTFKKAIYAFRDLWADCSTLFNIGLDVAYEGKYNLLGRAESILDAFLESHYTKAGREWVNWFIFENDFGKKGLTATDGDESICYDLRSLFEYIEENHRKYTDE